MVSLSNDEFSLDINSSKLALTSFIYVNDEENNPQEYQRVYNLENRVWIDFECIPEKMKDAVVSIEDKRFYGHKGVDWIRTSGAVVNLISGKQTYGGSTLTQQLIKNITDDNKVSLTRKLREIFRAIKLEEKYSKDEILEAYLNVVNFGAGSRGVQAAANIYFNKSIKDCSLAQCAAIAAITQNPTAYNPIYHPENNKKRREIVLQEMYLQKRISEEEYNASLKESESMRVSYAVNNNSNDEKSLPANQVRNWYVEATLRDVVKDLCVKYNIGRSSAENMILTQGLKIYCAMDKNVQSIVENTVNDNSVMPKDSKIELGYIMMNFDGRVLATIGSRKEKTGNLWYDRANNALRQPGSIIKPVSVYAPAIDMGMYTYSSLIPDEPLEIDADGNGTFRQWPSNWYRGYRGNVILKWALEKSANAPAAQILNVLGTKRSYEFLTQKLGFASLDSNDANSLSALATGGTHSGVTVREMTAAFQIFGNGGRYYKPYTYFYVTDRNDKIILDNRANPPIQSVNSATATIMNRLLRNVVIGPEGTGRNANISGWNIIGKTGTTNDDKDCWFIGESPYSVGGIWIGYDNPKRIHETPCAIKIWKHIMTEYLKNKPNKNYDYDKKVIEAPYCNQTGQISNTNCPNTSIGYYSSYNIPRNCTKHGGESKENIDKLIEENDKEENSLDSQINADINQSVE
jgi:penicillin-binding protein 1A